MMQTGRTQSGGRARSPPGIAEELLRPLRIMERIVSQNTFHKQHMIYRNYPTLEEMAKLDAERMKSARG